MKISPLLLPVVCSLAFLPKAVAAPFDPEYSPGNLAIYTTSNSLGLNATTGAYFRFTATDDTDANSLHININAASLTATSLTFGLQADNGSGAPSGTFLAQGTVTPVAGWNSISFAGQSLLAGQVYHVVMLPTVGGNANLRRVIPLATPVAYQSSGIKDANYGRGSIPNGVPGAAVNTDSMVFAVGTTGTGMGFAYTGNLYSNLSPTAPYAQRFQFHADAPENRFLDEITIRLGVDGAVTAQNLRDVQVTLLSDANLVLGTAIIDSDSLSIGSVNNYTFSLNEGVELTDGAFYRLAVNSTGIGTQNARWYYSYTDSTSTAINSATFQGLDGYAFSYTNGTFATTSNTEYGRDYLFSYTTTAVPEPTTYVFLLSGLGVASLLRRRSRA